ncbi:unnamed protein product [Sphagnum balticum]
MKEQIGEQVRAFVTGFSALIAAPRLALFSAGELQMLIAGATDDLDLGRLESAELMIFTSRLVIHTPIFILQILRLSRKRVCVIYTGPSRTIGPLE